MIEVINPGLLTTIQDTGRWGYQAYGMPVAGAMDQDAYKVANILVGNEDNAAALEMTLMGGSFRFDADCIAALSGAEMQAKLDGEPINNWSAFQAPKGSTLTLGFAQQGCRAYLAVRGGIDVPVVLGSRSTYTRASIGGFEGRALKAGDSLAVGGSPYKNTQLGALAPDLVPTYSSEITVRVLLGPQDDLFTTAGKNTLFENTYTISNEADRMGYRLEGAPIQHLDKPDIVSDALCLGAIQVPGHGMPIVMMADRQTTGGYAKIGAVISSDLNLLAQAKPGDTVRFLKCSDGEAVAALKEKEARYERIAALCQAPQISGNVRQFTVVVNGQTYNVEVEEII